MSIKVRGKGSWTAGLAFAVVAAAGLAGCVSNQATGKRIFTLGMSKSEQVALGAQAAPQFSQEMGGPIPDPRLQAYVKNIGAKMAALTEADNPKLPWEFTLLNTDQINAFALPGGKVFFTRGLAEKLTTEAQMAGVMGHEIGHVTAEHGAQRIAQQTAFNVGLAATAVVVGVSDNKAAKNVAMVGIPALAIGGNLVLLKYGRDEELEADRLGVRYMSRAGYNPRGQLEVMQVLQRLSQGAKQPEFLSTHPDPGARVEQVQKLLQGEYASTQGNPQFQDFADRYRDQFLSIVKTLPPAPAAKQASRTITIDEAAAMTGIAASEFRLEDPTSWCAHCRLAAIEREQAAAGGPEHDRRAEANVCDPAPSATARGLLTRGTMLRASR